MSPPIPIACSGPRSKPISGGGLESRRRRDRSGTFDGSKTFAYPSFRRVLGVNGVSLGPIHRGRPVGIVAVPAMDEADRIEACLAALACQRDHAGATDGLVLRRLEVALRMRHHAGQLSCDRGAILQRESVLAEDGGRDTRSYSEGGVHLTLEHGMNIMSVSCNTSSSLSPHSSRCIVLQLYVYHSGRQRQRPALECDDSQ